MEEFKETLHVLFEGFKEEIPEAEKRFIISVDLCDSTAFKRDYPETWYTRTDCFLKTVIRVFEFASDKLDIDYSILKFMGDELFYTIRKNKEKPHDLARKIIETYEFLDIAIVELNTEKIVGIQEKPIGFKMVFDYGKIYPITPVADLRDDIVGETMDRMARIAKHGIPNFIIYSGQVAKLFIDNKSTEAPCLVKTLKTGEAKGIDEEIDIYVHKGQDDDFRRRMETGFYDVPGRTREFFLRYSDKKWKD